MTIGMDLGEVICTCTFTRVFWECLNCLNAFSMMEGFGANSKDEKLREEGQILSAFLCGGIITTENLCNYLVTLRILYCHYLLLCVMAILKWRTVHYTLP